MQGEQPALVQQHAERGAKHVDPDRMIVARVAGAALEADRAAVRDQVTRDAGRFEQEPGGVRLPIGACARIVAERGGDPAFADFDIRAFAVVASGAGKIRKRDR